MIPARTLSFLGTCTFMFCKKEKQSLVSLFHFLFRFSHFSFLLVMRFFFLSSFTSWAFVISYLLKNRSGCFRFNSIRICFSKLSNVFPFFLSIPFQFLFHFFNFFLQIFSFLTFASLFSLDFVCIGEFEINREGKRDYKTEKGVYSEHNSIKLRQKGRLIMRKMVCG